MKTEIVGLIAIAIVLGVIISGFLMIGRDIPKHQELERMYIK